MRCIILMLILPFFVFSKTERGYIEYSQRMTRISTQVFYGEELNALEAFDSLYHDFDFIFSKDLYLGLQLAGKLKKEELGFTYLREAICQGIPSSLMRRDSLINGLSILHPGKWMQIMVIDYDYLRSSYLKKIDTPYKKTLDSLYELDQKLTNKLNDAHALGLAYYWLKWNHQNKKHVRQILHLISLYGYPGEKLMGLSTVQYLDTLHIRYGTNCFLGYHQTEFIFIHYFSTKRESLNAILLPEVEKGMMSGYEFAVLNDFMATFGKKKYKKNYYDEWHHSEEAQYAEVEKNRKALGLCPLALKNEFKTYWQSVRKNKQECMSLYLPSFQ